VSGIWIIYVTNYDVEVDDEEFNTEKTISKIMNEIKDRKKKHYPSENEMMKVNQRC
jgi:hemerythrin